MHAVAATDVPYLDRVLPAIDAVADRFVTLATGAPDPAVRVPASPAWTVRDVAAHLVVNPILPGWVRPERVKDLNASFELRLRGQATYVWAFREGRLHVNPRDLAPVDVHVSADPAALLLVLYARQPLWRHVATGRLLAWGRKPWLALTLTSRFHRP
jgi:hypothetical protein